MKQRSYTKIIAGMLLFISVQRLSGNTTWESCSKAEISVAYEKAIQWFSGNSSCSVSLNYASFMNYTTLIPSDESSGFYRKSKTNFHVNSVGIRTLCNGQYCLVADTANQIIVLKNKTEQTSPIGSKDLDNLLSHVQAMKKMDLKNGITAYRLEFKPNDIYTAFEFRTNSSGTFDRITYYYSKEAKEDEDDEKSPKGKPRMEISFSNYATNVKFSEGEFSTAAYVKENGRKILLNEHYKNFELKDYRVQPAN
ncbi:MAG: hypothetical protein ACJ77K_06355 [Bacteroidia bacterium]